jgi:chromosome partitioning protein
LLGKIEHSKGFNYAYAFFDCPPYSVLGCSSLILIPVNPDVFASRGIGLMIDGLRYIEYTLAQ